MVPRLHARLHAGQSGRGFGDAPPYSFAAVEKIYDRRAQPFPGLAADQVQGLPERETRGGARGVHGEGDIAAFAAAPGDAAGLRGAVLCGIVAPRPAEPDPQASIAGEPILRLRKDWPAMPFPNTQA